MGGGQRSSSREKIKQVKANWTPENHELFVDLCLQQIPIGNRPGTHLNREGWNNLLESFHTITGLKYERVQLKNHWDWTKKHWMIWHKLISTSEMKWDPDSRTFGASEQEWNEYLEDLNLCFTTLKSQENPDAAPFRQKELLFAEKLDIVFDRIAESGETSKPTQKKKNNDNSTGTEPSTRSRKQENSGSEEEHLQRKRKRGYLLTKTNLTTKEPAHTKPVSVVEHCYDESRSVITVQSSPHKLSYSIEECIKYLDSVEEIEQGCELYLFALDIFLKKEYREIFLNLKKPSTRIAWLERLQSVGPPLPLQ